MKQIIFLRKSWILFLFVFIWNSNLLAQRGSGSFLFISPGNNSCNAGQLFDAGVINFPVPPGLTLAQLNYLETDFRAPYYHTPLFGFEIQAQSTCGLINLFIRIDAPANLPWINSGNLARPGTSTYTYSYCNQTGQTIQYGDVQTQYGSSFVVSITLVFLDNGNIIDFDNTRVNNRTYNYDDCDNDGLLDIYDCDPAQGGNNKVLVCHNGQTICVAMQALQTHLNHGDYMGSCAASRGEFNTEERSKPNTEESAKPGFNIYPNPATNQITIQNNNKILGNLTIYDVSGKIVYQKFVGNSKTLIDVQKLLPGVYYLRSDQMETVLKFVKQ